MNRNTKIALVVVGSLSLICVLACVGVALLGGRIAGQVFTTDPQQARDIGRQIADYTPPPGYTEQMSMNVLTAKWVIIGPAGRNGVIFMLMQALGMRREQIELQMRQAVQAQLGTGGSLTLVDTRNVIIKGRPVDMTYYEGATRGGARMRQAFAEFDAKRGTALLMVAGEASAWSQAVVDQFIASIK